MKGKQRKRIAIKKLHRKNERYLTGGKKSRYARKADWLRTNGGEWGFNVAEPKPWR